MFKLINGMKESSMSGRNMIGMRFPIYDDGILLGPTDMFNLSTGQCLVNDSPSENARSHDTKTYNDIRNDLTPSKINIDLRNQEFGTINRVRRMFKEKICRTLTVIQNKHEGTVQLEKKEVNSTDSQNKEEKHYIFNSDCLFQPFIYKKNDCFKGIDGSSSKCIKIISAYPLNLIRALKKPLDHLCMFSIEIFTLFSENEMHHLNIRCLEIMTLFLLGSPNYMELFSQKRLKLGEMKKLSFTLNLKREIMGRFDKIFEHLKYALSVDKYYKDNVQNQFNSSFEILTKKLRLSNEKLESFKSKFFTTKRFIKIKPSLRTQLSKMKEVLDKIIYETVQDLGSKTSGKFLSCTLKKCSKCHKMCFFSSHSSYKNDKFIQMLLPLFFNSEISISYSNLTPCSCCFDVAKKRKHPTFMNKNIVTTIFLTIVDYIFVPLSFELSGITYFISSFISITANDLKVYGMRSPSAHFSQSFFTNETRIQDSKELQEREQPRFCIFETS